MWGEEVIIIIDNSTSGRYLTLKYTYSRFRI